MWWIADDGGIEQSDGSFLHQRTHTPDPLLPLESRWPMSALLHGELAAFLALPFHTVRRLERVLFS